VVRLVGFPERRFLSMRFATDIARPTMEASIGIILQGRRKYLLSAILDHLWTAGPQFIAVNFETFIHILGMIHIRTSPLPSVEWEYLARGQIARCGAACPSALRERRTEQRGRANSRERRCWLAAARET
jgi:hypothetical protein